MKKLTGTSKKCAFRVLLVLLILAMTVSGCGKKAAFEKGFGYTFTPRQIMFGMRSDTDTFAIDDVTLDLYFGTYDIDYCQEYNVNPRYLYAHADYMDERLIFALYICNPNEQSFTECADYKEIENYYFVREISEKEALSEEYGFTMSYWKDLFLGQGITYNHCEKITIPAEFFTEAYGELSIHLIAFQELANEDGNYIMTKGYGIDFSYQVIDENTIKISK